ncbi:MAG: DNA processing protein [Sphingobacteriales bacterium]|jgi:DNA processing protein
MKNSTQSKVVTYDDWIYRLGLNLLPGIGDISAKILVSYCGGAKEIFEASPKELEKIPGIGRKGALEVSKSNVLERAQIEFDFMQKNQIAPIFYTDPEYPKRLKFCQDAPIILFKKGNVDLNRPRFLGIVGTRNSTNYGRGLLKEIMDKLLPFNLVMVSGLAYGIDICAHREALNVGIPTISVLAHGLDRIYPNLHRKEALEMQKEGAILSEFFSGSLPDRENFPKRNRIIAGMVDALLVVEASKKGGALITADLANGYSREVFAVPGRLDQPFSEGCNDLIRTNKASLFKSVEDLTYLLNWELEPKKKGMQQQMIFDLPEEQQRIVDSFQDKKIMEFDALFHLTNFSISKLNQILLNMEIEGLLLSLPGKAYKLKNQVDSYLSVNE